MNLNSFIIFGFEIIFGLDCSIDPILNESSEIPFGLNLTYLKQTCKYMIELFLILDSFQLFFILFFPLNVKRPPLYLF